MTNATPVLDILIMLSTELDHHLHVMKEGTLNADAYERTLSTIANITNTVLTRGDALALESLRTQEAHRASR